MKKLGELALWLLIFGGIGLGYQAAVHRELFDLFGAYETLAKGVIGVSALIVLGGRIKG